MDTRSHILLRNDALLASLGGRMIYFEADDGRICLVYDYLGLALVGSTDIPAGDPDSVKCDPAEIDYLLDSVRSLMPGIDIQPEQIVYAYSGIRPLPASNALVPGLISRDHSAPVIEPDGTRPFPIISLVGGKWTTFRGFAEEVADTVLGRLSRQRTASTQTIPIGGGRDFPTDPVGRRNWLKQAAQKSGIAEQRLDALLGRYGTRALAIVKHGGEWTDCDRLPNSSHYSLQEIDHIARTEAIMHLADIVLRRTTLAVTGSLTLADLHQIAAVADKALSWGDARRRAEIDATVTELATRHGMQVQE